MNFYPPCALRELKERQQNIRSKNQRKERNIVVIPTKHNLPENKEAQTTREQRKHEIM